MSSFRDLKEKSRAKLHAAMSFPAAFYEAAGVPPVKVPVRKHITNPMLQGDMKGTNLSYAEVQEAPTTLVFEVADVPRIDRGSIVIFSTTEGYLVDHTHVPYGATVKAEVKVMTPLEISDYQTPDLLP